MASQIAKNPSPKFSLLWPVIRTKRCFAQAKGRRWFKKISSCARLAVKFFRKRRRDLVRTQTGFNLRGDLTTRKIKTASGSIAVHVVHHRLFYLGEIEIGDFVPSHFSKPVSSSRGLDNILPAPNLQVFSLKAQITPVNDCGLQALSLGEALPFS